MRFIFAVFCIALSTINSGFADDLQLSISTSKSHYLLDEPLLVRLEVKNVGNSSVQIWSALLDPGTSGVLYEITEPDGKKYTWDSGSCFDWAKTPDEAITLFPGQSYSLSQDLTNQPTQKKQEAWKSLLHQSGHYKIQAVGIDYNSSNVIEITVSSPTGKDKVAYDELKKELSILDMFDNRHPPRRSGQYWRDDLGEEAYKKLLANSYSTSIYSFYSKFYLAKILASSEYVFRHSKNEVNTKEAVSLFNQIVQNDRQTGFAVPALMKSAKASLAISNFGDALDALEKVFAHPQSTTSQKLEALYWMSIAQVKSKNSIDVRVKLEDLSRAFGLRLSTDLKTRRSLLTGQNITAEFYPNSSHCRINGESHECRALENELGHYEVDLSVVICILGKSYVTKAFDYILERPKKSTACDINLFEKKTAKSSVMRLTRPDYSGIIDLALGGSNDLLEREVL